MRRADDFHRVLGAEVISNFGSMLSRLALPWLAALTLGATPLQMGWLVIADVVAGALGSLGLGALIDRLPKRAVMLAADLARAAVLALLAALAAADALAMWMLGLAAAANGLLTVGFELARSAWMAQGIAAERLPRANAQLSAGASLSETAAFALGGWLFQGLGALLALATDAMSYLLSALCLRGVREIAPPQEVAAEPGSRWRVWWADTRAGIALLISDPALRALAVIEILVALFSSLAGTSYMIFVSRDIGLPTGPLGMIFAAGGLGALAGAAVAPWLGRRLGAGGAMALGLLVAALGNALVPLIGSAGVLAMAALVAQQVIGDGGHTLHAVHERTLRQTVVAPAMLARVDGGLRTLGQLATLFGALAGGAIGDRFGARSVLALGPLLLLAAALWCGLRLGRRATLSPADFPH